MQGRRQLNKIHSLYHGETYTHHFFCAKKKFFVVVIYIFIERDANLKSRQTFDGYMRSYI